MKWIRSYPVDPPAGRACVIDQLPRFMNSNYDYSGLAELDDDVLLVEWDIALSKEDRQRFEDHAMGRPNHVLVAPHWLYHVEGGPALAHRVITDDFGHERWVTAQDQVCDYFAFGLIYLPRYLIRLFLEAPAPSRGRSPYIPPENPYDDTRLCDQTFSMWHRHHINRRVEIDWSVFPVHLHY